jgi:hypothetical protein
MKIQRPALVFLAMLVTIAAATISAPAQRAGFQIAIAPPVYYQPTVNPPLVIPGFSQPMTVPFTAAPTPMWFPQAPVFVTRPAFQQPFQPQFYQQFRQQNAFVPAQTVIIQTVPVVPQTYFGPPVATVAPVAPVVPVILTGTPRAQVLVQLGQPSVSIVTRSGETLYFNGGVTVIIQNGQVITGPR